MKLDANYVKYLLLKCNFKDNLGLTKINEDQQNIENFEKLSTAINMHIKSLNFQSRAELIEKNIAYKNEYAIFGEDGNVNRLFKSNSEDYLEHKGSIGH